MTLRPGLVALAVLVLAGPAAAQPAAEALADAPDLLAVTRQAWGELGFNAAAHASGQPAPPLKIGEKTYATGLGTHADGEIVVELGGRYDAFEAEVGVQTQPGGAGSVVFRVFVDDEPKFDSGVLKNGGAAKPVRVPLAGAQELRLVVADAGDGVMCDLANWANARLVPSPGAGAGAEDDGVDVAPFARVATWNPARLDGAKAGRVEEFRPEDLYTETDVMPDEKGNYVVPVWETGARLACIGLQWLERRRLRELALVFPDDGPLPAPDGARVETWIGESAWQGGWKPYAGTIAAVERRWVFRPDRKAAAALRNGTRKIRWIWPAPSRAEGPAPSRPEGPAPTQAVVLRGLSAQTRTRWDVAEIRLDLERPVPGAAASIEVYNGEIESVSGSTPKPFASAPALRAEWDLGGPLRLAVRHARPGHWKADRTVLRLSLPGGRFGIAVDDVLANPCVFVRETGVLAVRADSPLTVDDHLRAVRHRATVLDRVRSLPDQTLAQALAKTRNPIQDHGPVLLSLACDNRKWVVLREGGVRYNPQGDRFNGIAATPAFGTGRARWSFRRLPKGWMPFPEIVYEEGEVRYSELCFVAPEDAEPAPPRFPWLHQRPLFVAVFTVENRGEAPTEASLALAFDENEKEKRAAAVEAVADGAVALAGGQVMAWLEVENNAAPLALEIRGNQAIVRGTLPAKSSARCVLAMPGWAVAPGDAGSLASASGLLPAAEAHWNRAMAGAAQIDIPDRSLLDVIRASQVHCLIAGRNEAEGARIAAWIASVSYGPLESESHSVIRGMSLLGHEEFARRSLDFFVHRYNAAGFLTTGYTLMGTGWHLWTLGEHYALGRDRAWMKAIAPEVARVCRWIAAQREKTKKTDPKGGRLPESGLMPPGVLADWNAYAYYFCGNGYYQAGLAHAARALADVEEPGAEALLRSADEFRADILRAYRWTRDRMPVVPLQDGTWTYGYPSQVHVPGPTADWFPGEDANRSWCYDVELGAHQLVPQGVLPANGPETAAMLDHMEDVMFLSNGWFDYDEAGNRADWYHRGGFSKVQPYYCRNAEIYAMRDDVEPFVRSYFNALASLLNTEVLALWEHFHASGAWCKTHETGYFLQQTRFLLATEWGDELWLAPFAPRAWLADGREVSVRNLPTRFGPVAYAIRSSAAKGIIEAEVEPPARGGKDLPVPTAAGDDTAQDRREPAPTLVLRLRHPNAKPIRSVTVNGAPHADFDPAGETIRLPAGAGKLRVQAGY